MIYDENGNLLVCPECGSAFVDYDHHHRKYRCLKTECPWIMEKECDPEDHSALVREEDLAKGFPPRIKKSEPPSSVKLEKKY